MAVRRQTLLRRSQSSRRCIRPNIEPLEDRLLLATFFVNLTSDQDDFDPADGNCDIDTNLAGVQCTLRAAIQQSNVSVGVPDEIQFNIGTGGPQTIGVPKALPAITDRVSIDGTTQPPQLPGGPNFIELDGRNAGAFSGLSIDTLGTTVRGLVINRFGGSGIAIQGGGNHTIAGNFIGTDGTGFVALPNTGDGISLFDSRANTIGGANASDKNLISGNASNGVGIFGNGSTQNLILGNRIGLNAAGNGPLPNGLNGIHINGSPGNTVGGSTAQARNVISANLENGVRLTGAAATGNVVLGNSIGTDANSSFTDPDGTPGTGDELGNRMHGVRIDGAPANLIGGTGAEEFNIIAGNRLSGVNLAGVGATDNVLRNNFIGTNTDGIPGLGNFGPGVFIQGASKTTIGGPQPNARNVIAFNTGDGVLIVDGAANRISRNVIRTNVELGIDLAPENPNFPQDADPGVGANNLQNFPELTPAAQEGTSTKVHGTLTSVPNTVFMVEFFQSFAADDSGFGEGQTFLATFDITVDASGVANINELIPLQLPFGTVITATATDPNGNTSEFSNAVLVTPPDLSIDKNDSADPVIAGTAFTYPLTVMNNGPGDATGVTVADALPNGFTFNPAASSAACAAIGQQVTCNVGLVASGATAMLTIGVQVASSIAHGTVLSNTATVGGNEPDFDVTNNQSTEVTTVNRQVDLRVAVADNLDPVIAGSGANNLVYTVTVTNDGPSDASGVIVDLSNVRPAGASFVSALGDGMNSFDGVGTDLWTIGTLARNAAANLTVTYTVGPSTAHNAVVSLTADNAKANESLINVGNDADTETTTANRQVDLRVAVADVRDPVIAGSGVGNLVYTVTVTNDGPSDAGGVTVDLSNILPAGVSFVSATGDGTNNFDGVATDLWTIGLLALSGSANLTVTYTVAAATAHNAIVSLTADDAKANETLIKLGNDAETETTTVNRQVDLRVAVTDNLDPVIAGAAAGNLVYTVTVTNDGPSDASGVTLDLSNVLPASVSFVSATGDGTNTIDGIGTDLWTIGLLARNAAANLTVTYTVGASAAHGALVRLTADNAMANEPLVNAGNDADTETTTINRSADLSIDKTDTPDPVLPGGTVTYTLTVQNAGPSDAAAVKVTDTLPAGVTFRSASPTPGCTEAGGVVTCDLGALAAGASTLVRIDVSTDPAATGVITNTATVASATFDPIAGNDMTTEDTTVVLFDLVVTEFTTTAADRGTVAIRYTIVGTPPAALEFAFFASADARHDLGDAEQPPRVRVTGASALTMGDHLVEFDGGPYAGLINDPATPFVVTRGTAIDAASNAVPEAVLTNNDVNFLGVFHHGPFPAPLMIRGRDTTDRSNGLDLPLDDADDMITLMGGATVTIGSSFSTVPIAFPSASVSAIRVLGLGGNDTITADATMGQPLSLRGGFGDDMLTGGAVGDELLGGIGDDTFKGGLGDDVMVGGGGIDTADFSILPAGVVVDLLAGTARGQGRDTLTAILNVIGSAGRDRITGNAAPNMLFGGGANDVLIGGDGGDFIDGGLGNDSIFGDGGADMLMGSAGNDCVCGGAGGDTMDGGAGNDRMDGGDGDDEMSGGAGNDIICGGAGNDILSGESGKDSMDGGAGIDRLLGGLDFDSILFDLFDLPVDLGGIGKDGGKAFRA